MLGLNQKSPTRFRVDPENFAKNLKIRKLKNYEMFNGFYKKINIKKMAVSRVILVTAMHFGGRTKALVPLYNETAKKNSYELLRDFERRTDQSGLTLSIFSNEEIDRDICFMVSAKNFVGSHNNLSYIINQCRYQNIRDVFRSI